ncbi:hypothetical protein Cni_G27765 [Canna indica]|uniref:Reverse transcriptase domain-containing protein n=1 Tax=Canna indica TaxID=4628 RepID=A0AAQ3L5J2_9LILI|nr:hypothetical protein Cni_G27765 [Canna indica]
MQFMNFPDQVRTWIHACLSSARFSYSINGQKSTSFSSAKGVRQGDPLSPYIFIIMQDLLSRILNNSIENGSVKGFKYKSLVISHLAFADDILISIKGNAQNCRKVMEAISLYCSLTDQKINTAKFEIFFPINCQAKVKEVVTKLLGFKEGSYPMKYLGALISPNKVDIGSQKIMLYKATNRIEGWAGKSIFQAGRMTLLNSVMNAIPMHTISSSWVDKKVEIKEKLRKRIGDGASTDISKDPWFSDVPLCKWPTPVNMDLLSNFNKVKDLIKNGERNFELILELFGEFHYSSIVQIYLPKKKIKDLWIWSAIDDLNRKAAYNFIAEKKIRAVNQSCNWNCMWSLKVLPRVKNFLWKLLWGRLPTASYLSNISKISNNCCHVCGNDEDNAKHIFFDCAYVKLYWEKMEKELNLKFNSMDDWIRGSWL